MKKVFLALLFAASLFGADVGSTEIFAIAFKTAGKLAVPMHFTKHEFTFQSKSGQVPDILSGASAVVSLNTVDSDRNPLRDKNINEKFFAHFKDKTAKAKIKSVNGNNRRGSFVADVLINGSTKELNFDYEVSENKIIAKSNIDLSADFALNNAYEAFKTDKIIEGLHGKKTWSDVEIGFEISVSNL